MTREAECGNVTVLVVDDAPVVRRIMAARLRQTGYAVLEAADGEEALVCLRGQPAQVVITDLHMPRLGGLDLLATLRRQEAAPEVILLTSSGASDAEAAVRALRLGAHDYIAKDAAAGDTVLLAVRRAAEKWRLREENHRLLDELRRLSLTDELTSVGNRRAFDDALAVEVARARRHQRRLALALVDLDHFKRVNDSLGHQAGDDVVAELARRLVSLVRASDLVFRYGGEEFAVLLPDEGTRGGLRAAWRIVRGVAESPIVTHGRGLAITCSAGVAALSASDGADGAELLARSDAALYAAKRGGRDRAVSAREPAAADTARLMMPLQPVEAAC